MDLLVPELRRFTVGGISFWGDSRLIESGVVIGFSERGGGCSLPPFASLNLASHVGDDPARVDENRARLLEAAGIAHHRERLVVAQQVHGSGVVVVGASALGSGASALGCSLPVPQTDALVTAVQGVPLMLCFADCVPIIFVAPTPAVAVAHAGWRGVLASIPGKTARELARASRCETSELTVYIGAHVGACHYAVGDDVMSQFRNAFGTVARADSGGLDLDATVTASLIDAGVTPCSIARLGICTAEATDRFFSYRSEDGHTGRHAAFACVL